MCSATKPIFECYQRPVHHPPLNLPFRPLTICKSAEAAPSDEPFSLAGVMKLSTYGGKQGNGRTRDISLLRATRYSAPYVGRFLFGRRPISMEPTLGAIERDQEKEPGAMATRLSRQSGS